MNGVEGGGVWAPLPSKDALLSVQPLETRSAEKALERGSYSRCFFVRMGGAVNNISFRGY